MQNGSNVTLLPVGADELTDRVVSLALQGETEKTICKTLGLSLREVHMALAAYAANVSAESRAIEVELEVGQLTAMQHRFFGLVRDATDAPAACACAAAYARLSERKASLRGFDIAPKRLDDRLTVIEATPRMSDVQRLSKLRTVIDNLNNDPDFLRRKAQEAAAAQGNDASPS